MATEVTLPQLGESVTEGTITAWLVEVGQHVDADQPLFELSSDKIDTEVPSPASGTLTEIKVAVDETVDVGTVVAVIGAEGEGGGDVEAPETATPDAEQAQGEPERSEAPQSGSESTGTAGEGAQDAGTSQEREEVARDSDEGDGDGDGDGDGGDDEVADGPQPGGDQTLPGAATTMYQREEPAAQQAAAPGAGGGGSGGSTEGVLASPIVRRMLTEHDLDPSTITPTGEGGRITREDVEQAVAGQGAQQPAAQAAQAPSTKPSSAPQPQRTVSLEAGSRERVEDLSRIRQRIAAKMMESLQSAAQLTTVQEADMTRIMRLRERYKDEFKQREGVSLSPFVFLCRAAVLVLRRPEHATASAQADWDAGKVKYHDYINLGIAVDTEKGLLVPNIKRADDLTLAALARAVAEAADKARGKGRLEMQDIEGGTFTMTNTGSRGVLIDTPILNYPEVGILGTGAIKQRPVVTTDENGPAIAIRDMIYLSMTYDHRLLDGADAARFVTDVKHVIETHDWSSELGYAS